MAIAPHKIALSLPELHEILQAGFSNPPSLPTIKRWAAAGKLKPAEIHRRLNRPSRAKKSPAPGAAGQEVEEGGQARVRYDRHKAVKLIQSFWELFPIDQAPLVRQTASTPMPGGDDILAMLSDLGRQIAAQGKLIEAATAAAAQLNSTRAMLMNKYDAVNTQQAQIIDGLRQRLNAVEGNSSLSRDIQQLRIAVSRLADGHTG